MSRTYSLVNQNNLILAKLKNEILRVHIKNDSSVKVSENPKVKANTETQISVYDVQSV